MSINKEFTEWDNVLNEDSHDGKNTWEWAFGQHGDVRVNHFFAFGA